MSKKIGQLAVVLSADHSALSKGLKSASAKVSVFGSHVRSVSSFAAGKVAALGGAIGAGLTVSALMATADGIDSIAKASERLQIPVENLMGLQYGAKLAGIEAEALDQAILTMTKGVELGAQGLGRARKGLADLGLDVNKLARLTPENQLKVIAEAIGGMEDKGRAAADAMSIFGAEGAKLVPFFAQGAAGLEAMQTEAEGFGLTLNAVDVNQVVYAKDALDRVWAVLGNIAQRIVIEIAPYVSDAADRFLAWSKTGETWKSVVGSGIEYVATGIAHLLDLVDYGKIAWEGLKIAGAGALWLMLKPTDLLIKGILKLVELAADYLPQSMVDAAAEVAAFSDGFMSGIEDGITESANKIADVWTGPTMASKVEAYFAMVKAKGLATADEMSKTAPVPVKFTPQMVDFARTGAGAKESADPIAKAIQQSVSFGQNKIIRAGSAEAQAAPFQAYTTALERRMKEQMELARRQLAEQEKIAKNTRPNPIEDMEPEVIFEG